MKDRLVFLSDVHIGSGARTNWYQPAIHEGMLRAVFEWVLARAGEVGELILLGDFVDQWTYLPDQRPPSFADIAAANPAILGPGGAVARCLDALDGAVTYVNGNHDMSVTAADLTAVKGANGASPRYQDAFPYLPALGQGQLACAHGHQFSVFNAPDLHAMPAPGLPLGHLVTRLGALWSMQHLGDGQTVADLPGSDEPTGWPLEKDELLTLLVGVLDRKDSLPQLAGNALLEATGQKGDLPITLLDGTTQTVQAAQNAYGDLFTRYHEGKEFPGSRYGDGAAYFALMESDLRNRLDHFARQLGKKHKLVVMGHTHHSEDETQRPILWGKDNVYSNTGFGCPSKPDLERAHDPRRPTFVDVQVDAARKTFTVSVHGVVPDGGGQVLAAPLHQITIAF